MTLRESILEAVIRLFNRKGMKFTMDDIAAELAISKKTIYTVFNDKNELIIAMVDYCFDKIKESEDKVMRDPTLSTVEKLNRILGVLPDGYKEIEFGKLYMLKDKFPDVYTKVEERIESGWDKTIFLLEQGMKEGSVRRINIPLVKTMFEATLEQFFSRDILLSNNISYSDALNEVVSIIMDGIRS